MAGPENEPPAESTKRAPSHSPGSSAHDIPAIEPATESDTEYWSDSVSDLTSITSSVTDYVYENGRRYHSYRQGKYVLPNDELEKDRLDLQHHIYSLVLHGKSHLAPLNNPQNILDLGTGTGIWALDMADQYPSAIVIGNDLSPIQPAFIAPNSQFVIEDFEEEWLYPENKFDFIHGRTLTGSVKDWKGLFAKAYKHLKPGGWLEFQETSLFACCDDGTLKPDSAIVQAASILEQASLKNNRSLNICDQLQPWMIEAGFCDVHLEPFKVPVGPWPKDPHLKEIGRYYFANTIEAVDAYALALMCRGLDYTEEQAKIFLAIVKAELRSKALHVYNWIYIVYGRKPFPGET